jgi:hypothetical protein
MDQSHVKVNECDWSLPPPRNGVASPPCPLASASSPWSASPSTHLYPLATCSSSTARHPPMAEAAAPPHRQPTVTPSPHPPPPPLTSSNLLVTNPAPESLNPNRDSWRSHHLHRLQRSSPLPTHPGIRILDKEESVSEGVTCSTPDVTRCAGEFSYYYYPSSSDALSPCHSLGDDVRRAGPPTPLPASSTPSSGNTPKVGGRA